MKAASSDRQRAGYDETNVLPVTMVVGEASLMPEREDARGAETGPPAAQALRAGLRRSLNLRLLGNGTNELAPINTPSMKLWIAVASMMDGRQLGSNATQNTPKPARKLAAFARPEATSAVPTRCARLTAA